MTVILHRTQHVFISNKATDCSVIQGDRDMRGTIQLWFMIAHAYQSHLCQTTFHHPKLLPQYHYFLHQCSPSKIHVHQWLSVVCSSTRVLVLVPQMWAGKPVILYERSITSHAHCECCTHSPDLSSTIQFGLMTLHVICFGDDCNLICLKKSKPFREVSLLHISHEVDKQLSTWSNCTRVNRNNGNMWFAVTQLGTV